MNSRSDTDRLAALLHESWIGCAWNDKWGDEAARTCDYKDHRPNAERLIAAGVTLLDEEGLRVRIGAVVDRWYHLGLIRFNSRDDGGDDLILRDELVRAARAAWEDSDD